VKINCGSSHSGQVIGSPGNIKLTADGKEKGEFTHLVEKLQKKQRRPAKPYEIKWKNGPPTRTEPKDVPESETDKRNYFVALKVPPGPWLDRLKEDAPPDLEFQHPEDLHMTVAYLGKIGEAAANEAFDSLAGMAAPPIEATLESMEVLGGAIALSPTDGNDASKTLMGSIKEPLELEAGRQPDERQPRPHVTVATTSGTAAKRREAAAQWAEGASPTPAPVKLDTLGLYVRNDGPGKPAFKLIRSKKLSG